MGCLRRQLHDQQNLPAGDFETHFSFAQALTESAKVSQAMFLLVIVCQHRIRPDHHTRLKTMWRWAVTRGRKRLTGLRMQLGAWKRHGGPPAPEEGFEIVRHRIFEPHFNGKLRRPRYRGRVLLKMYRRKNRVSARCSEGITKAAESCIPHPPGNLRPALFRLVHACKIPRTAAVLRLMAAVIHSLWNKETASAADLPVRGHSHQRPVGAIRIDAVSVGPVGASDREDVDGGNSLPCASIGEIANLGKYSATRRLRSAIYLGSAPMIKPPTKALSDRRIKTRQRVSR